MAINEDAATTEIEAHSMFHAAWKVLEELEDADHVIAEQKFNACVVDFASEALTRGTEKRKKRVRGIIDAHTQSKKPSKEELGMSPPGSEYKGPHVDPAAPITLQKVQELLSAFTQGGILHPWYVAGILVRTYLHYKKNAKSVIRVDIPKVRFRNSTSYIDLQ